MTDKQQRSVLVEPGSIGAWVLACRPKTLLVGIAPVLVGLALAFTGCERFDYFAAVCAFLGAVFLQIGSNLANDVFDFEKGADNDARIGPTRAAQAGLLSANQLKLGVGIVLGMASLVGVYLVYVGGLPLVVIGLASMVCALAYTGGPWPLGYLGLGDLFVFIFFGPVAVCGSVYVTGMSIPDSAWILSVSLGALATNVLVVNNLRDLSTDRQAGKKTLAVRFGRGVGVFQYGFLYLVAYATVPICVFVFGYSYWLFLPWVTLPLAIGKYLEVKKTKNNIDLNKTLAGTAMLTMVFSMLLVVGIVI